MDTPTVTSPPTPIILPGSPGADERISIIKLPDPLTTIGSSGRDVWGASNVSSPTVEPGYMIATPEEKTDAANDTDDCAPVKLPESILDLEHTEKEADKAENRDPNGEPESPVSAPEVSAAGLVGEHVSLRANQSGAAYDTVRPSTANWVHDLHPSDDNKSPTDNLDSTGVYQKNSAVGPDDRLAVAGSSVAEEGNNDEKSSISRIVDYLFAIGTGIGGALHAASEEKHDISTDEHVFPTATQQISTTFVDCPIIPEATGGEAHQAEADAPTASEIIETGTSDKGKESSSDQPIDGLVTSGPVKRWPGGPGNEFPTGESASNLVIPGIVKHKKTPNNANAEPLIVVSTNTPAISETRDMPVNPSDGYSTDRADLDTIGDGEDRRLLTACPDLLTPSSTVSSQVGDFQESEDELEDGEIREDMVTVFHDAVRFNVKHPLSNKWTLWYTRPSDGKPGESWGDLLKEIQTFDSVEEFWAIYNNVPPPSALATKSDYQLFKFGIRPEWEDPANKRGGRFSFLFRERRNIDTQWLDVLLATIGETLEPEGVSEVQGVVANIRKGFTRISCWTRTAGNARRDKHRLMALGRHFKAALGLKNVDELEFSAHDESASAGSVRAKISFSV